MQSCDELLYLTSDIDSFVAEKIVNPGFFDKGELAIFSELIQQRMPLPIFHGDIWRCFGCGFWSDDFTKMAAHILKSHEAAPFVDEEDAIEHDSFKTNCCDILF